MERRQGQTFRFLIAAAIGVVCAVVLQGVFTGSGFVLAVAPILFALGAYVYLGKRSGSRNGGMTSEFATPNQCHPALAAAGIGAWLWDAKTNALHCTEDVFKILGHSGFYESLTMEEFKGYVFREDLEAFERAMDGVIHGQRKSPFDCRFVRSNHSLVWVEVTMCLIESSERGVQLAGALTDVTERKHVEHALDSGSANLEAILESTDDVVFSIDRQCRLTMLNKRFQAEMRAAYGLVLHVGDDFLESCGEELVSRWKPRIDRTLEGESLVFEDAFVVKGRQFLFNVSLKPIRVKGYVNGVAVYGRNITRQRQRERELQAAKEQAVESDRLKSAFLANMSHEIRTPLNAVMGFAQLLKSDTLTAEESERFIEVILSNGNHLLHILGDIIDLAQIESGQLRIDSNQCDLGLLMTETYSVFFDRIRSREGDMLELLIENDVREPDFVVCDQTRLKQVVYNLVSNAVKFTLQGSIRVGYEKKANGLVEFFVCDTGTGISSAMKERIFQRFRQGSDHVGHGNDGVGLGLSICEGLVKLLGGKIWIENNEPHGSIFKFTIKDHSSSNPSSGEASPTQSDIAKHRLKMDGEFKILVAEDDETNFQVINEFLRFEKIAAVRAVNGRDAIDKLNQHSDIALVVMDLSMPIMDGLAATREIRKSHPELPIIAHTAHAMQNELDEALDAGCTDCLVKPISIDRFRSILDQYI